MVDAVLSVLPDDATAKAFVREHHYSGSYPAARWRFGLFRRGVLQGVAVFSHPCNDRVLTSIFPGPATGSVELGRFVLLDEVPGNGETWFLGRCFARLRREGLAGVVAFSDPCRRLHRPRGQHDGTNPRPPLAQPNRLPRHSAQAPAPRQDRHKALLHRFAGVEHHIHGVQVHESQEAPLHPLRPRRELQPRGFTWP